MVNRRNLTCVTTALIIISLINQTLQYYSYDDCGAECKEKNLPCNIYQTDKTEFSVLCLDVGTCYDNADDRTPCVVEDAPTRGGSQTWPIFKQQKVHPKPTPEKNTECEMWKMITIGTLGLLMSIMSAITIQLVREHIKRRTYERIPDVRNDSPYQPTVEEIPDQ